MQVLDHVTYLTLSAGAEVLEADGHGDKVLRLSDGTFFKLFRRKRLMTSALFYPYAQRFADNTDALRQRGIPCPRVLQLYRVSTLKRDLVHYCPLPGETLRQLYNRRDSAANSALQEQLGAFIARLHDQGIYFRSLHLGNIVLTPDGDLGLIDIADMKLQSRPLSRHKRLRNFQHLLRYREDRIWLLSADTSFFTSYLAAASRLTGKEQLLRRLLSL